MDSYPPENDDFLFAADNIANAAEKKAELMRLLFEYFRSMHLLGCEVAAAKIKTDILLLSQNKKRKIVAKDWTAETLET